MGQAIAVAMAPSSDVRSQDRVRCCRRKADSDRAKDVAVRCGIGDGGALSLRPADFLVAAFGGRPSWARVAVGAFASAAAADVGLLPGGLLPTRISTRSAVSRSVN